MCVRVFFFFCERISRIPSRVQGKLAKGRRFFEQLKVFRTDIFPWRWKSWSELCRLRFFFFSIGWARFFFKYITGEVLQSWKNRCTQQCSTIVYIVLLVQPPKRNGGYTPYSAERITSSAAIFISDLITCIDIEVRVRSKNNVCLTTDPNTRPSVSLALDNDRGFARKPTLKKWSLRAFSQH